jgi:hypothetical protein
MLGTMLIATLAGCKESGTPVGPGPLPTATPTLAPTATPAANNPPVLGIRAQPDPIRGTAPFMVTVNMCTCSDKDADPLTFEYKWGGGGHKFGDFCRHEHTYTVPGQYDAWFCVSDGKAAPVCRGFKVDVN